jgi:N-acetylmuramoyl-L-alanine amidase
MSITIDRPNSQTGTLSGSATVTGWAIDNNAAISNVAVAVDGISFGNASYGVGRPDVCAVFPGRAGCPNVGWSFLLNTTLLADGSHTLDITGTSAGGQKSTLTSTFSVSNAAGNALSVTIDAPAAGVTLSSSAHITGWALNTGGSGAIAAVQILVDGALYGDAIYGAVRGDVCAVYPSAIGCPDVGWVFILDTTMLANGPHTLEVRSLSATGPARTVSVPFNILN